MARLMAIIESLFSDSELQNKKLSDDQIVVNYNSDHTRLNTIFKVQVDDDGYEHYTRLTPSIPAKQQGNVALEAIIGDTPYKDTTPFLSEKDNSLYLYGSQTGLSEQDDNQIRDNLLDVLGRNVAYDNEKRPGINRALKKW